MTEIVILPGAKYKVLIFTCGCDLTPIAEQPILVTQKKGPPVPYGPTVTAARSVLCSVRRSRYPWVTFLVVIPQRCIPIKVSVFTDIWHITGYHLVRGLSMKHKSVC
jgi:hypothetical protein